MKELHDLKLACEALKAAPMLLKPVEAERAMTAALVCIGEVAARLIAVERRLDRNLPL